MQVQVLLFGRAAAESGASEILLELSEGSTLRDVARALLERFPVLTWIPEISRPARNLEYSSWSQVVVDGDEVSFIPPVSGGSAEAVLVQVLDAPLDPAPLVRFVEAAEMGAVVTFSGNVRNHNRGRRVSFLEYDAYRPMAEKQLLVVAEEAVRRWGCRIAIQHRVGRLEVGEASVLVVASCAHRGDAFDACRFAIDTLKECVPIWKREVWEDGEEWIEGENPGPGTGAA